MDTIDLILRLLFSAILGGIIGVERQSAHKPAGLRTYAFVSMGSALFTMLAIRASASTANEGAYNAAQMIGSILVGVGFIGGGVIMHKDRHVEGVTTAAGLWVAAGIGIAIGLGQYVLALTTVILTLVMLLGMDKFKGPDT